MPRKKKPLSSEAISIFVAGVDTDTVLILYLFTDSYSRIVLAQTSKAK